MKNCCLYCPSPVMLFALNWASKNIHFVLGLFFNCGNIENGITCVIKTED